MDNGRTGTVFDRPEFNRLMNDIRTGRIKCLVVRDLSRFGRDYIEAGTYLERVFPQIGLRFIAIKENYDNFDADGSGESLIIPLQNMINTLYSKDISRKVSTALKAQMESGEFKKRNLPYGYRWDEEHSNMVFDEETAPIVRKIFQWKIEGLSLPAIADRLDAMNAPNPEFQKYQVGVRTGNATAKKIWNKSSPVSYTHLCGTMNAAVHTAATQQRLVGSIDDGVHLHFCDVISDDLKRHDQALPFGYFAPVSSLSSGILSGYFPSVRMSYKYLLSRIIDVYKRQAPV